MREVDEHLKTLADNVMALFAANAGDESHAAGVVLISGMVEALWLWSAQRAIGCIHGNLLAEPLLVQNALPELQDTAPMRSLSRKST
jgi:hypothetical protein